MASASTCRRLRPHPDAVDIRCFPPHLYMSKYPRPCNIPPKGLDLNNYPYLSYLYNKINKNTFWKEVFDAGKKEELFLE